MSVSRINVRPKTASPHLESERVILRPPRLDDFEPWAALRRRSRHFLTPWEPSWSLDHLSRSAFRRRIRRYGEEITAGRALPLFLFAKTDAAVELAGGMTVSGVRRGAAQSATLGYWIGEPFQKRGLMTEAVGLLARHAFFEMGLHRLEAACLPDNAASRRVLEKSGFTPEGVCRGYIRIAGEWRDHIMFARLADDP